MFTLAGDAARGCLGQRWLRLLLRRPQLRLCVQAEQGERRVRKLASEERHSSMPWCDWWALSARGCAILPGPTWDQRPSRAGPTSPVCEEAAVRPQGPANSLTLRPSPFNPGDASVTARQPAATRVVRRPPECRVRIRGPSRDRGPKRDVGAGRAIRAARWRERRKRSRRFPRRSQRRSIGYRPEATPHFLTQSPFIGSLASDPIYTLQSHIFVYQPRPVVAHPKFASLPQGRRPAASRVSKHGPPQGRS